MEYYTCRCGITYNINNEQQCPKCRRKPVIVEECDEFDEDDEYVGKNSSWWTKLKEALGLTRKDNQDK